MIIDDADDAETPTGSGGGGGGTGGGGGGTGGGGTPGGGGGEGGGVVGQPPISGDGLLGDYFDNENLTNLKFTRKDYDMNLDFGAASPGDGTPGGTVDPTTWSARWTGRIEPEFGDETNPELYTFHLPASDGSRLWISGHLVIDNWADSNYPGDANRNEVVEINDFNALAANYGKTGMTWEQGDFDGDGKVGITDFNYLAANYGKHAPPRSDTGSILLSGNEKHDIIIEFRNATGPANLQLYWESPEQQLQLVPHQRLFSGQPAGPANPGAIQVQSVSTVSASPSSATPTRSMSLVTRSPFSSSVRIATDDQSDALKLAALV